MSNFALANVVWLFSCFVVCTNLLFKSNNETPSNKPRQRKKIVING